MWPSIIISVYEASLVWHKVKYLWSPEDNVKQETSKFVLLPINCMVLSLNQDPLYLHVCLTRYIAASWNLFIASSTWTLHRFNKMVLIKELNCLHIILFGSSFNTVRYHSMPPVANWYKKPSWHQLESLITTSIPSSFSTCTTCLHMYEPSLRRGYYSTALHPEIEIISPLHVHKNAIGTDQLALGWAFFQILSWTLVPWTEHVHNG